ncbi:hypothetical protein PYW08_005119 [Mythimna loreyi]|uniref:Uncharacterized protein n=1 Tax=Mythimna loreyi TaxID=667449 RepID=A0ACC2QEQ2_9NEOP|nr:hypothetical protein PYW08_005119 [Mythimna loreyi]
MSKSAKKLFTSATRIDHHRTPRIPSEERIPRRKSHSQEVIANSKKAAGNNVHELKSPNKPIIHCYTSRDDVCNPVTTKKTAPVKKISFVLPGDPQHELNRDRSTSPIEETSLFQALTPSASPSPTAPRSASLPTVSQPPISPPATSPLTSLSPEIPQTALLLLVWPPPTLLPLASPRLVLAPSTLQPSASPFANLPSAAPPISAPPFPATAHPAWPPSASPPLAPSPCPSMHPAPPSLVSSPCPSMLPAPPLAWYPCSASSLPTPPLPAAPESTEIPCMGTASLPTIPDTLEKVQPKVIEKHELQGESPHLLSEDPKIETPSLSDNNDTATLWKEILTMGMKKDVKEKILESYLIPKDFELLQAPALNPKIKNTLQDSMQDPIVNRDLAFMYNQNQIDEPFRQQPSVPKNGQQAGQCAGIGRPAHWTSTATAANQFKPLLILNVATTSEETDQTASQSQSNRDIVSSKERKRFSQKNKRNGKTPLNEERMDWKDYHRLEVIYNFMDDLEANFPSICTTASIGRSVEGRHLKILKISNSNASNVAVWMDAGIHAREWIAPAVNTYIANHISRNFESLPDFMTNKDWYFLPVVNPDGYHYSHTTDRLWRKSRAFHNGERYGVDLNRNFGIGWGGKGSSEKPNNPFYRGPYPFSEPESAAMRDVFMKSGINFKVYITLHSFGQIIIFPYSCTTAMAPDYVQLLEGATAMSKAIYRTNGQTYKVGISRDVMYASAGTSSDFAHGAAGIPFCYLIELRSKAHKFKLPKEEIEDTGREILNSVIALMQFIDTYKCQKSNDFKVDLQLKRNESALDSCTYLKSANSYSKRNRGG